MSWMMTPMFLTSALGTIMPTIFTIPVIVASGVAGVTTGWLKHKKEAIEEKAKIVLNNVQDTSADIVADMTQAQHAILSGISDILSQLIITGRELLITVMIASGILVIAIVVIISL